MATDPALRELLDHHQLRQLAERYARAIDRRDGALLLSLYHPDAIDEHGTVFEGSPADYVAAQPELMDGFEVTAHYILNSHYAVAGDEAEGELYFVAYHRTRAGAPEEIVVGGRYLDRYQRRGGVWKFQYRRLVWDHYRRAAVAAEDLAALRQLGPQGSGADDPAHVFFKLLQSPR
jgi:hypothetical protein